MEMDVRHLDGAAEVTPRGELDVHTGRQLDEVLRGLADDGVDRIHLDLSRCSFIDSSALGILLRWREDCEQDGRDLQVSGAQGAVKRVFRLTRTMGE